MKDKRILHQGVSGCIGFPNVWMQDRKKRGFDKGNKQQMILLNGLNRTMHEKNSGQSIFSGIS